MMFSVDGFKITVRGRGAHGAYPHTAIDPINIACHVYLALEALIAREVDPAKANVLTIGQLSAGDTANVIPERAVLQGTLRTFSPAVRERLCRRLREVVAGVAQTYRCTSEYEVLSACPSVVTDEAVTASVEKSIRTLLPQFHILGGAHGMGSEDFAEIAQKVPAAYYMMGAGPEDSAKRLGQHNPKIIFNEDVLPLGAAIYARAAFDYLSRN
jgi:amidohydrolase